VAWTNEAAKPEGANRAAVRTSGEYDAWSLRGTDHQRLLAITLNAMGVKAPPAAGSAINHLAMHGSARIEGVPASAEARHRKRRGGRVAAFQAWRPARVFNPWGRAFRHQPVRCGRHRSGALRHLHRRGWCLHHRSAHRTPGAAWKDRVRRNAGMASLVKVLQTPRWKLPCCTGSTRVLSTFTPDLAAPCLRREDIVEKKPVTGIAYSRDEAKITCTSAHSRLARRHFRASGRGGRECGHDVQNVSEDGKTTDLTLYLHARRIAPRAGGDRNPCQGHRLPRPSPTPPMSPRSRSSASHARPSRRGADDVPHPVGQGHQHPGDLDLRDQGQRADRRGIVELAVRALLPLTNWMR